MKISRRDILKFAVGSATGIMLTPVPWKVLDDTAIWTQNWPWIPVPKKGEGSTRFTTCALCPAGCGIRARCIERRPVTLAGVAEHPLSNGTLCPVGLGAHHLAYHPGRLSHPVRRSRKFGTSEQQAVSLDEATHAIAEAIRSTSAEESVAILDLQPGRSISRVYRQLLAHLPNGAYVLGPVVEDATLVMCARMSDADEHSLGYDLENARTIVSFGAPLFDGWGTPGRMMRAGREPEKAWTAHHSPGRDPAIAHGFAGRFMDPDQTGIGRSLCAWPGTCPCAGTVVQRGSYACPGARFLRPRSRFIRKPACTIHTRTRLVRHRGERRPDPKRCKDHGGKCADHRSRLGRSCGRPAAS